MPAEHAGTTASTDVKTYTESGAVIRLLVDVQVSEAIDPPSPDLPACGEFERWAEHVFTVARAQHWDTAWRARIGADGAATVIDSSQLCIRLVGLAEGETLNATWRNKQAPTNVLSFEADIVAGQYAPLGDLVLCVPVIEREAMQQGKSVAHHCAHLVVHGVLHLLGFDHLIDTEAQAMEAMEAKVLGELGISNPYE